MGKSAAKKRPLYLAVLIPHREGRSFLRRRSAELFASGLWGAWSFPHAAPLALLSAPLTGTELRNLAHALRALTQAGGGDGTLRPGPETALPVPGLEPGFSLYGPALGLAVGPGIFGGSAGDKLGTVFPRPLLGCAVLGPEDWPRALREIPVPLPAASSPPGAGSFRAAAVANMLYRPLAAGDRGCSYSWRIGELHWLPSCRRAGGSGKTRGGDGGA
jgi:hypothetical protein